MLLLVILALKDLTFTGQSWQQHSSIHSWCHVSTAATLFLLACQMLWLTSCNKCSTLPSTHSAVAVSLTEVRLGFYAFTYSGSASQCHNLWLPAWSNASVPCQVLHISLRLHTMEDLCSADHHILVYCTTNLALDSLTVWNSIQDNPRTQTLAWTASDPLWRWFCFRNTSWFILCICSSIKMHPTKLKT